MKMDHLATDQLAGNAQQSDVQIDPKRILFKVAQYWYWVVLSLSLSLLAAYLINRYSEKIYSANSSIIIREKSEASASILYNNALSNFQRNYLNEPFIIRSYPLIGSVIHQLNFDVAFYLQGSIITKEIYPMPVKVNLLKRNGSYGASMIFTVLDDSSYSVKKSEENRAKVFHFNDSIVFEGHHFLVAKDPLTSIGPIKNIPLLLTFLNPLWVTGAYIGNLDVQWAMEGAGVLNLTINGSNRNKEIDFLKGLVAVYQAYDLEQKNQEAERTVEFIKMQLKDIADSLSIYEGKLEQFSISNSMEGEDEETIRLLSRITPLEDQQSMLRLMARYYDYLVAHITAEKNYNLVVLPSSVGIDDQVLTDLINQLIEVQFELKLFLQRSEGYSDNPLALNAIQRLEGIKSALLEAVRTMRKTDEIKADHLQAEIAALEKEINLLPATQRKYISIKRNYTILDNLYVFLMQKMAEASITKAANVSDVVPVNPPMDGPMISPKATRNYLFGGVFGVALPVLVFILLELLNNKIQSKEDIEKITSIPIIGGIGHNMINDNLAVSRKPRSAVAESLRAIRSNLNFFTGNELKKVFLVGSSVSGEGKTFTTINLATVFAMSGRRTLIVGADMRKPKIFSDFGLENNVGLSGYLSGLNTFKEVVQRTSVENLDLISGGPVPPNPSELLLSGNFETLIKDALQTYDYIIVDTPPLAIVTDAFLLAKYADHTLFLVRQNFTKKGLLKEIKASYGTGRFNKISIVLNDIRKSGYGYGYGYAQGYGRKKDVGGYYS